MAKMFVPILMIFCHIVDDYYLQGILASMKQKRWWEENAPSALYKYDYIVALAMHGFSWAFMIMLPIAVFYHFSPPRLFIAYLIGNCVVHAVIDNAKANSMRINLIADQAIHLVQLLVTYMILM